MTSSHTATADCLLRQAPPAPRPARIRGHAQRALPFSAARSSQVARAAAATTRTASRDTGRRALIVAAADAGAGASGEVVLVAGATGGVGQLVTAKLLDRGYRVRAVSRSADKARELFGDSAGLQIVAGDFREPGFARQAAEGVGAVACCLGTTAFPSLRWRGGGPEATDLTATSNLVNAAPRGLSRFVLVSSVGVDRFNQIPFSILNAFGVLGFKKRSEERLRASGLPFTIIRPGRLTDGPYTSYDLNTLLQATSGQRRAVRVSRADDLQDEASRIAVAEAVVQVLGIDLMAGQTFSLSSSMGEGPGTDAAKWRSLLASLG